MSNIDPESIIEGCNQQLRDQWRQHRKQSFNANTKGATYETTLKKFLDNYYSDIYNIYTRTAVVDRDLECFDTFDAGESELDVVACFKQAVPGIILESGDMRWVPYDGVAFVCEVKSKLTTSSLESDLEKLAKLNNLGRDHPSRRFDPKRTGQTKMHWDGGRVKTTTNRQLKCLVYDESSISPESLMEKLQVDTKIWDLVLVVEDDIILASPNLPFVDGWYDRFEIPVDIEELDDDAELLPDVLVLPEGVLWFILLIGISVPRPSPFDATQALLQLVQREWKEEPSKYNKMIGAWHQLS